MTKLKIAIATLLVLVAILLVGDQLIKQSLRHTDFGPLAELFKARLGEVLTIPMSEPADLKDDAKLFDTYRNATLVVNAARDLRLREKLPLTSINLSTLPLADRVDAWGNPFCLVELDGRVAAISRGQKQDAKVTCKDLRIDLSQLNHLPSGKLYKYPSGLLVFLGEAPRVGTPVR